MPDGGSSSHWSSRHSLIYQMRTLTKFHEGNTGRTVIDTTKKMTRETTYLLNCFCHNKIVYQFLKRRLAINPLQVISPQLRIRRETLLMCLTFPHKHKKMRYSVKRASACIANSVDWRVSCYSKTTYFNRSFKKFILIHCCKNRCQNSKENIGQLSMKFIVHEKSWQS